MTTWSGAPSILILKHLIRKTLLMLIMMLPKVTISGRVDGKVKHVNPKSCSSSLQLREKFSSELWWTTTAATKEMTEIFIFWHLFLHLVHEIFILGNWMLQYKWWWWCWDYCRGTAGLDLESGQSMLMQSQHPHHPRPNTALAVTPRRKDTKTLRRPWNQLRQHQIELNYLFTACVSMTILRWEG